MPGRLCEPWGGFDRGGSALEQFDLERDGDLVGHQDAAALPAFYYDWAAQIARQSPRSQAATLGALGL